MAVHNIRERRAYIQSLIDEGKEVNVKEMIKMWDSSYPAIRVDIELALGNKDPYYQKVPVWIAQNQRATRGGNVGTLTEGDWDDVLSRHNHKCIACGTNNDIVIDHIMPLSRGGTNTKDNIQPLCRSCNTSKRNKTMEEWEAAKAAAARANGRKGGRPRKS